MPQAFVRRAVLFLALAAGPVAAQSVHPGIGVRVEAPSVLLGRLEAVYLGRTGDTLLFGNAERGPIAVPSAAITKLEVSAGRSRWRGAFRAGAITAGIFAGLAALTANDAVYSPSSYIAQSAVSGGLFGMVFGAFMPMHVWKSTDTRLLLTGGPRPHGGASVGVSFSR